MGKNSAKKIKTTKADEPDEGNKNNSSTSYVQILGNGMDTHDTSPSVLLFFDQQRFIFNAGEGLQRFCTEHKIKLSKVDYIFLSRVCSETAGGLPGLLLTLAGMGSKGTCMKMWGPPGIEDLTDGIKTFFPHSSLALLNPELEIRAILNSREPIRVLSNELVTISAILLRPNVDKKPKDLQEAGSASDEFPPVIKLCNLSLIYVCQLSDIQGKFHRAKAQALGLEPGKKYGDLKSNKSVKLDDISDNMVHPCDVMDPPIPGPIVLLVDCPTASHLEYMLSLECLNQYYTDLVSNQSNNGRAVNCVIHLSSSSVTNIPDYQEWMKRFGSAQHIMAGYERKNAQIPILKASTRIATRLNYLCPQFFPPPWSSSFQSTDNSSLSSDSVTEAYQAPVSAENLLRFNLLPCLNQGLDKSCVPVADNPAKIIAELLAEIPELEKAAQLVRQLWDPPDEVNGDTKSFEKDDFIIEEPLSNEVVLPSLENISRQDMEIVLLGTGSSQPSKYRNVSSVYINLFSRGSLLFDCGEGTLGQLKRRFGIEGANNAVKSLRCLWISHIHADHHSGIARILSVRSDLLKGVPHEPLLVVGPEQLGIFLSIYEKLEELDMQFLDCENITRASWDAFESSIDQNMNKPLSNLKEVLQDAGLETLISFPVWHCPEAFGVSLTAARRTNAVGKTIPGWKIVYSGDTRPCSELTEAACGATVLIHEATFEDAMEEDALKKMHSTTKEAIKVGKDAGVYRTILTHFSQRYPKIPVLEDAGMDYNATSIAFDLMSVNMADLPLLPKILPYLKILFRNNAMSVDDSE